MAVAEVLTSLLLAQRSSKSNSPVQPCFWHRGLDIDMRSSHVCVPVLQTNQLTPHHICVWALAAPIVRIETSTSSCLKPPSAAGL